MTFNNNLRQFKRDVQKQLAEGKTREALLAELVTEEGRMLYKRYHLNFAVARSVVNAVNNLNKRKRTTVTKPVKATKPVETTEQVAPDFAKAARMDKKALDEYAEEFGIKLNRSKTKANMLDDFQMEWNAK